MTGLSLVIILIIFALLYVVQLMFHKAFIPKLVAITYLFFISSGIYFSFDTYKGWPSKDKLDKGYLVYSITIEPDDQQDGAIYYWAIPDEDQEISAIEKFFTYKFEITAPRSYYLPYSKEAASMFGEANEKIKQGYIVEINGEKSSEQAAGGEGKPEDGTAQATSSGEQENYLVPHLEIIPPDTILRKGQNE